MTQTTVYLKGSLLIFYQSNSESINQFIREEIDKLPEIAEEKGDSQKVSIYLTMKKFIRLKKYCKKMGRTQTSLVRELIMKYRDTASLLPAPKNYFSVSQEVVK